MMNRNKKWIIEILLLLTLIVFVGGCSQKSDKQKEKKREKIITAKLATPVKPLYFSGTLYAIKMIPVFSPVDGQVTKMMFKYGETVVKGQPIVVLSSPQLSDKYRKAINDFLQKKNTYENNISSFQGTQALYNAKVISKEEYLNAKAQYETNILDYFQSRYELEKILTRAKVDPAEIEKLSIADTETINKLLQRQFSSIMVKATATGIALFPVSVSGGGNGGDDKKVTLSVGTEVKLGQRILSIGDLKGLSMQIEVSEVNINRIKQGMKVVVTGDAFPGVQLQGEVISVSSQANPQQGDSGGGVSTFNVDVHVPHITEKQRKIIHVGMSAQVRIDIKESPRIMLPIKAVFLKDGKSMVTIIDKKGQRKNVVVQPGDTTPTKIAIISGIKPGDKVVVTD